MLSYAGGAIHPIAARSAPGLVALGAGLSGAMAGEDAPCECSGPKVAAKHSVSLEQMLLMQGIPIERERAEGAPVEARASRGRSAVMTNGDTMIERARERLLGGELGSPATKRRLDLSSTGTIIGYGLAAGVLCGSLAVGGLLRYGMFKTRRQGADRYFIVTLACCVPTMVAAFYAKLQIKP